MSKETKSSLEEFTNTELEEELARREKEKYPPTPIEFPNFEPLKEMCVDVMNEIATDGYSKDHKQYIFECAVECVFGKDVWKWYGKNIRM